MGGVDAQLAEDILTVCGDGVDAGETLGGNLLGGLAQGYCLHDFHFCRRQNAGCIFFLLLDDDGFKGTLAKVARVAVDSANGLANLAQRTVLEYYAELMRRVYHTTDELRC